MCSGERLRSPVALPKGQYLLAASFDRVDHAKRPSARTWGIGEANPIAHFVADQRLSPAEEHRDEDLGAKCSGRNRAVVIIYHLGDDQILVQVHSGMERALGSDG